MNKISPFVQAFDQLSVVLPIFPLPGALLLPHSHLPLNIFEPRYLNMIEDALAADHLIGMIQPISEDTPPQLASVGCAGRITRYEETLDGRLEIILTGVCRFQIDEEINCLRGYRLVKPSWAEFSADIGAAETPPVEETLLLKGVIRNYLKSTELEFESSILDKLDIEDLVNSLAGFLPLSNTDRQILLESDTLTDRIKSFSAILQAHGSKRVQH